MRCATRRSARSRSSAPTPARSARARRSSSTSKPPIPSRRCCRRSVRRGEGARAGRPSSICTSSWSRASSIRRCSSAARSTSATRRACASASSATLPRSRLARFDPTSPARIQPGRLRRLGHLPVISMATQAVYGEDLLVAGGIDWKPYAAPAASGRARRGSPPIARPGRIVRAAKG